MCDEGGAKAAAHGDGILEVDMASRHEHNDDHRGQHGCGGGRRTAGGDEVGGSWDQDEKQGQDETKGQDETEFTEETEGVH